MLITCIAFKLEVDRQDRETYMDLASRIGLGHIHSMGANIALFTVFRVLFRLNGAGRAADGGRTRAQEEGRTE